MTDASASSASSSLSSLSPSRQGKTLVLALGNDLLGDDGVGLLAARRVRGALEEAAAGGSENGGSECVDIVESGEAGLALLEMMEGYRNAILLDAIVTGAHPPGTIIEFGVEDFARVLAPSPHYAGLPEVLALARRLDVDFPEDIRVLAMEVENPYEFQETLTEAVGRALPGYVEAILGNLQEWKAESAHA